MAPNGMRSREGAEGTPGRAPRTPQLLGACLLALCAALLLSYDFEGRGPHFAPDVSAKTDRSGVYDLSRARRLTKMIGHVRSHYVDPDRVQVREMAVAALREVQGEVPEVLVEVERAASAEGRAEGSGEAPPPRRPEGESAEPTALEVTVADEKQRFDLGRVGDLYELNWKLMDVFEFLQRQLPPHTELEDIEYAAVNGILSTLDPHSVLLTPKVYREMQLGTQGRFGGLGIVISVRKGLLTVMSVMDGTPADRAGLQSGDAIVQIGEESTINMPLDEAVNRLRGKPGTEVTIRVKREGSQKSRAYTIAREQIEIRAVEHHELGGGVGYVRVRKFQDNTFSDLQEALKKLEDDDDGLEGLVLDLRENPGGLLEQAVKVSDLFIAEGSIVTTVRERGKKREQRHATRAGTRKDLPLVVLINRGSASASEIVSGALKHNDRGLVLGHQSFGKGSVQVVYQIDDAALKLTIAKYLTPGDISIQSVGIVPDIAIQRQQASQERIDLYSDQLRLQGEAGLESHLERDRVDAPEPSMRFRIFEADEGGDEAEEEARTPPSADDDDFEPDTLVQLARDILEAAPVTDRPKALEEARPVLREQQASEDEELVQALETLGVDWREGEAESEDAPLRASLRVAPVAEGDEEGEASEESDAEPEAEEPTNGQGGDAEAGEPPNDDGAEAGEPSNDDDGAEADDDARIRAGDEVKLTARVDNPGESARKRLHGVIRSEIDALQGEELVFGRVEPGSSRRWSTTAELPESLPPQADQLTLQLYADGEELPQKAHTFVQIQGHEPPRFAYSHRPVADDSGDGLIQRGETIELGARVTNVGRGRARDVLATIENESGEAVYIDKGRHHLDAMEPGETARATFRFKVRESLKSQDVQLKLAVADQTLRVASEVDVSLPVFPSRFPSAEEATWTGRTTEGPVTVHAGAHRDAARVAELAEGTAVPVEARAGEWLRVALAEPGEPRPKGWIPAELVERVDEGAPDWEGVELIPQHEPPELQLAEGLTDRLVTGSDEARVRGRAIFGKRDGDPRYTYVFRNQDKVLFDSARAGDPSDDRIDFDARIELDPGRNRFTVVAREGEHDVTRRSFIYYHREESASAER